MKPLPSTIPVGWNADGWVQYLRTRAHSSDEHFPEVAAWYRAGADAVERAHETTQQGIDRRKAGLIGMQRVWDRDIEKEKEPALGEELMGGLKELPGAVSTSKPRRTEKEIDDFVDLVRRT